MALSAIFRDMNTYEIVAISPDQATDLMVISRKIFYDSFRHQNTEANMQAYMDRAYNHDKLLTELQDERTEYYFLEDGEKKIGFLKLNLAGSQSDLQDPESLEIERIYIDHAYQNRGLGLMLLEKAHERAVALNLKYIWLGVWEVNVNAIRFYERHGFEKFGSHQFVMGDEIQTDILMKKDTDFNR